MPPEEPEGGFAKRASHIISHAALYQLVEELAMAVDELRKDVKIILGMLRVISSKGE